MFDFLFKDEQLSNGKVALMVNNLGSTTGLELYNVANKAIDYLTEKGISVERSYVGTFMTALEVNFQFTKKSKRCLEFPSPC
jgi:dihydroxyacetone kinase